MLDALQDLVRAVSLEPDFRKATAMVTARVTLILDCDVCSLYIRDRKTRSLRLVGNEGFSDLAIGDVVIPEGEGVVGMVAERIEPFNTQDITKHRSFYAIEGFDDHLFKFFLGVPILHHGRVLGVLVAQRASGAFGENEEGFLASLATSLSTTIAHAEAIGHILSSVSNATQNVEREFRGLAGSSGIVIGKAVVMHPAANLEQVPNREATDLQLELQIFETALLSVRQDIERVNELMEEQIGQEELALFEAYLHMLDDDAIAGEVRDEITQHKQWAQGAVSTVFLQHVRAISLGADSYLAERSEDLRDLGERILANMQQRRRTENFIPDDAIIVGQEVSAAMLGSVPAEKLKGIVALGGSTNSHTSILARALNVPAVMGAADLPLLEVENATIIVDGFYGQVIVNPSEATRRHFDSLILEEDEFARELQGIVDLPSETLDGHSINLWVNIGLVTEITRSLDLGAEGIGLFRTEIPFADRERFPTEEEQRQIYRQHMQAFDPRPVTMRTLDIGGDKDLPYFQIEEDNPFLGWRGVRVSLDYPNIFLVQVRAMIKASAGLESTLRIMLPMISNLAEIQAAKRLVLQAYREVRDEGFDVEMPDIGVMIEVPALIYQARRIAREVEFLAVGSNDLTQYMLAVSRTNPRVASLYQEFHPAVIRAMRSLVKDAHTEEKPIGICGEMAGSVEGAVLCLAMGFDVLSMNATNLPKVKWVIRNLTLTGCRRILARVLRMDDAIEITTYIREQLQGLGLERAIPHHDAPPVFY